jgi:anti-anti-sigma factor
MEVQEITAGEVLVLLPVGRLDTATSSEFESHVQRVLTRGVSRFVVDCGRLEYVSSAGLRVLLMLAKRLSGGKGALVLCSMSQPVQEVFEIAGFSRIFSIESDRPSALERASSGSLDAGAPRRAPRAPAAPPVGPPPGPPPGPPAGPQPPPREAGSADRTVAVSVADALANYSPESEVEDAAVRLLGGDGGRDGG